MEYCCKDNYYKRSHTVLQYIPSEKPPWKPTHNICCQAVAPPAAHVRADRVHNLAYSLSMTTTRCLSLCPQRARWINFQIKFWLFWSRAEHLSDGWFLISGGPGMGLPAGSSSSLRKSCSCCGGVLSSLWTVLFTLLLLLLLPLHSSTPHVSGVTSRPCILNLGVPVPWNRDWDGFCPIFSLLTPQFVLSPES